MAGARSTSDSATDGWQGVTIGALGIEIELRLEDDGAAPLVQALHPLIRGPGHVAPFATWTVSREDGRWLLNPGQLRAWSADTPAELITPLLHTLNWVVCRNSPGIAVHAAAVVFGGRGILVAGHSNAGKSTLAAGLVAAGASYLGDEAIGITGDGRLLPYPKPLTLDASAQRLLPQLTASVVGAPKRGEPWHVAVHAIRTGAICHGARLDHLLLCGHEPGSAPTTSELSRAEALYALASHTFRFRQRARLAVDTLAGAVADATCHRLVTGDLEATVEMVLELVSGHAGTITG